MNENTLIADLGTIRNPAVAGCVKAERSAAVIQAFKKLEQELADLREGVPFTDRYYWKQRAKTAEDEIERLKEALRQSDCCFNNAEQRAETAEAILEGIIGPMRGFMHTLRSYCDTNTTWPIWIRNTLNAVCNYMEAEEKPADEGWMLMAEGVCFPSIVRQTFLEYRYEKKDSVCSMYVRHKPTEPLQTGQDTLFYPTSDVEAASFSFQLPENWDCDEIEYSMQGNAVKIWPKRKSPEPVHWCTVCDLPTFECKGE